jgi:hypothetical protein
VPILSFNRLMTDLFARHAFRSYDTGA